MPLPIQRKRWQSVLWPDEGDPVEKGGGRWAQASQRQEQKWEEVQVCHPLNRNITQRTQSFFKYVLLYGVRNTASHNTTTIDAAMQVNFNFTQPRRRHRLKYTHLTFQKLFTTEAAIFILVPWLNGGIANSEEIPPWLGHRLVACLENPLKVWPISCQATEKKIVHGSGL